MADVVLPLGKIIYVCDDAQVGPAQKLNILGAFDAVHIPEGENYPFTLERICLVAQFAGGRGQQAFRVVVVDGSTGTDLFGSPTYLVTMPGGQAIVTVIVRLTDCPFPHPGGYLVQLFCGSEFIDDRRLTLL